MKTDSFVINKIIDILKKLDEFTEYSYIYKFFKWIGSLISESYIYTRLKNGIVNPWNKDYLDGSLIMKIIFGITGFFIGIGEKIYNFFTKLNKSSLNKKLFDKYIIGLKKEGNIVSAITGVLCGISMVIGINYIIKSNIKMGIIILIFGIINFLVCIFLNEKIARAFKNSLPKKLLFWFFDGKEA